MRKGDLIKLKEGHVWTAEEVKEMGHTSAAEIPELLEVEAVDIIISCCVPIAVVQVHGYPDFWMQAYSFEVALEAGVPDVIKLMEEAKQMELMSIGF